MPIRIWLSRLAFMTNRLATTPGSRPQTRPIRLPSSALLPSTVPLSTVPLSTVPPSTVPSSTILTRLTIWPAPSGEPLRKPQPLLSPRRSRQKSRKPTSAACRWSLDPRERRGQPRPPRSRRTARQSRNRAASRQPPNRPLPVPVPRVARHPPRHVIPKPCRRSPPSPRATRSR